MKIPAWILLTATIICGVGMVWIFQTRPHREWPILLIMLFLGAWLAPAPK